MAVRSEVRIGSRVQVRDHTGVPEGTAGISGTVKGTGSDGLFLVRLDENLGQVRLHPMDLDLI